MSLPPSAASAVAILSPGRALLSGPSRRVTKSATRSGMAFGGRSSGPSCGSSSSAAGAEREAFLKKSLARLLAVFHGGNLRPNDAFPFWLNRAGLEAARLAEAMGLREQAGERPGSESSGGIGPSEGPRSSGVSPPKSAPVGDPTQPQAARSEASSGLTPQNRSPAIRIRFRPGSSTPEPCTR